jgi:multiple sugar transport system substrate-binding protein
LIEQEFMMSQRIARRSLLQLSGAAVVGTALTALPNAGASAKTVVTYGTPGSTVEDAAWEPVFKAFNDSHPDIEARYMALGGNYGPDYLQNLQTRIAAGNAPDVFFILDGYVAGFAERGVIDPIDELVANAGIDLASYYNAHINGLKYDDQLWGLPRDGAPVAMFYNADAFDEAGVAYPDDTWTWDTYLEAAKTLTKRDDDGRAVMLGASRGEWINWVWQAGGDIFNEDKTACILDQPEAIAGLQFAQDLVITHKVAPSAEDMADQDQLDMFLAGRLATHFAARGSLGAICESDFRFNAAIAPTGKVRMARTNDGPTALWSGSKNKDAAFQLLAYLCSEEGQRLKIKDTGFAFPSWKSLTTEDWFSQFQCGQSQENGVSVAFQQEIENDWVQTWPTHPKWPEIIVAITKEIDSLYLGEKTGEQVGKDATAAVNQILASGD